MLKTTKKFFDYNHPIKDLVKKQNIPCAYTGKTFCKRNGKVSLEHIHPRSKDGADSLDNFLIVNTKINTERGNMPFSYWLTKRPATIKHIQNYLDKLRGTIVEGQDYVKEVVQTLNKEAKGVATFHGKHNKLKTFA